MSEPRAVLQLDKHEGALHPDDVLSGRYYIESVDRDELRAIELSVLWYTVGQGEEDFGVHYFQRHAGDDPVLQNVAEPRQFATTLPHSPLSYAGVIVKVQWCVRLRVFLTRAREVVDEVPFQLGDVPRAQLVATRQPEADNQQLTTDNQKLETR